MRNTIIVLPFLLLLSFSLSASTNPYVFGILDTCGYDIECSIEYDFSEAYLSDVPGVRSYSFSCDSYTARGTLNMENGDSIYAEQSACHHFSWKAVLVTEREIVDFNGAILEFAALFEYHMQFNYIKATIDGRSIVERAPEGLYQEIRVVDPNDYLQDFYIILKEDRRGRDVIEISYYGG
ncbi:MAG TPA: hypothetical protein DIT65_01215 [Cryomorphaceae bacterium]|nr:hypothetical protein [Cryomorphaceae bacterium]|tara:strand:- start:3929 stop:4468 length:540 start_codon:yes stop_codon:yes gene_type:complete